MEIVFCANKKLTGCDLIMIAYELRCSPPKLEGFHCADLIEYKISDCPPMHGLHMVKKLDAVILAFMMALTNSTGEAWLPEWIHLYFGYGKSRKFLAYLKWRPGRYYNANQLELVC